MKKLIAIGVATAMFAVATPASAFFWGNFSSSSFDVDVNVTNSANVNNSVYTKADTGDNNAFGGSARNYVRGGNVDDTTATGGNADIKTGDAWALSSVANDVNYTKTTISSDCGCKGKFDVDVNVRNSANVNNSVYTKADTGDNDADGGDAKNKIYSSSKKSYGHHGYHGSSSSVEDTTATGGDADVDTGDAGAESYVTNLVNHTITRITR